MTERYFTFMLEVSERSGFRSIFEMIVFGDVDIYKAEKIFEEEMMRGTLNCYSGHEEYLNDWLDDEDEEENFTVSTFEKEVIDLSELVYYSGNGVGSQLIDEFKDSGTGFNVKIYGQV